MCESAVPVQIESFSGVAAKSPIGACIKEVLQRAFQEKRLTIGLLPAIQYLSAERALFCFTTAAPSGDSATHMQEVLLQAFCVENDIFVIKVDSAAKMRAILGSPSADARCVLVHLPYADPHSDRQMAALSRAERRLGRHCDAHGGPLVKLPDQ